MVEAPSRCPRCGALGLEGADFCVECGARIPARAKQTGGAVARTIVIDASTPGASPRAERPAPSRGVPRRRATTRGIAPPSQRPSLPDSQPIASDARPTLPNPPASMGEALKDVILDQIAREVDGTPAPPHAAPAPEAARDDGPQIELDDIEQSFDALLSDAPAGGASAPTPRDLDEAQALFKQIASDYLAPVRDFMVEIGMGCPSKDWLTVCVPAVQSLQKSADSMGLTELSRALERLGTAFDEVERLPGPVIGDVARQVLDNAHRDLEKLLPEAFAVAEERDRREPIIVQTLLQQVPGVRKVALDKIYAAGLTRLEMFHVARAEDIADATGLPRDLCQRIVDRFASFRREMGASPAGDGRAREHERLAELSRVLARQTDELERALGGERGLDKRSIRKQRGDTLLEIQLVLARLGRVDLVEELEKLPFARKVAELERFLTDVNEATAGGT